MANPGQMQMYNKPEPSDMWNLGAKAADPKTGEIKRIRSEADEKAANAKLYTMWHEDHTLGNALRMELLRNPEVLFAGYKVPHPLDHMLELRIQTTPKSSPDKALADACNNLQKEADSMLTQFTNGVKKLRGDIPTIAALKDDRMDDSDSLKSPQATSPMMEASETEEEKALDAQVRQSDGERYSPSWVSPGQAGEPYSYGPYGRAGGRRRPVDEPSPAAPSQGSQIGGPEEPSYSPGDIPM